MQAQIKLGIFWSIVAVLFNYSTCAMKSYNLKTVCFYFAGFVFFKFKLIHMRNCVNAG